MSKYSFKIIDFDFNLKDTIEDFANPFFSHKFYGTGEFQLDVNNLKHAAALKAGNIIFENADEPFIIESVEINIDENKMLAKGRQLKSIFDRRITYPPTGEAYDSITGDAETIMKTLIDSNCITAVTGRIASNLVIATNQNRGTSTTYQTCWENLLQALEKLAAIGDIGFDLTLDLVNSKFIFDVNAGVDRTYSQSVNSNPLWCKAMNTVVSQSYSEDSKNYKNFVVVGGKGEGVNRAIVEVEESALNTGWNRRETFVESTDAPEGATEETVLTERGKTCLSQFVNTHELDTEASNTLVYGTDYNLGDLVTVYESQISLQKDTRIVEVTKNYSSDGLQIHPVFGSNKPSATSIIQSAVGVGNEIALPITGTWTPVIAGTTTAGTVTYTFQYGDYLKMGKLLVLNFKLGFTAISGSAGLIGLKGWESLGTMFNYNSTSAGHCIANGNNLFPTPTTIPYGIWGGDNLIFTSGAIGGINCVNFSGVQHYIYGTVVLILQ